MTKGSKGWGIVGIVAALILCGLGGAVGLAVIGVTDMGPMMLGVEADRPNLALDVNATMWNTVASVGATSFFFLIALALVAALCLVGVACIKTV